MNALRRVLLLLGLLLLPSAASAQAPDSTALPAALREARATLQVAYQSMKADDALQHYADDITVQFGADQYRGLDAVSMWLHDALGGLAALRFSPSRFAIGEGEVRETATYSIVLPSGEESGGSYEAVWREQDGVWKVSRLTVQ